jgi:CheY-like chemotaxis protein
MSSTPSGARPGEIVLVVEDEPGVRTVSVSALRELGYTVLHASGGDEAIDHLNSDVRIDLLFTDVVMPDMNGRQLAERALAIRPKLRVLYTTGYARDVVPYNGAADAEAPVLGKPFTVDQLSLKVREVLDA